MKKAGIIIGILLIGAAYLVGFWPQHQRAQQAQRQLENVTVQLDRAQSELRLYGLQHGLLALIAKTSAKDYGAASVLSTEFFNGIRAEQASQTAPQVKTALASILSQRDTVTADLAKGDPNTLNVLNSLESTMFAVVDESVKGAGASLPAAPPPAS